MRYLIIIPIFILGGCCNKDSEPSPPYGTPDDISHYSNNAYKSVTYTYYCHNGEYISVSYVKEDCYSSYNKGSDFRSNGICPTPEQRAILNSLSPFAQREYLAEIGIKLRVSLYDMTNQGVITQ